MSEIVIEFDPIEITSSFELKLYFRECIAMKMKQNQNPMSK